MYTSRIILTLLALLSPTRLCLANETVSFPTQEGVEYVDTQFIIQYENTEEGKDLKQSMIDNPDKGIALVNEIKSLDIHVVNFPSTQSAEKWLKDAQGGVKSMEQDSISYLDTIITSDHQNRNLQGESIPYGIGHVKALLVDDDKAGDRKVCIVDSGYDMGHSDLPNDRSLFTGESFVNGYSWDTDENSHGTHVAGTIVALGGNGRGVVGVIRNGRTKLHISKVFSASGSAYTSTIIAGFESCVANGANVINMSLGGGGYNSGFANAIAAAETAGALTFASSGNSGYGNLNYPASYPYVISVASITESYERSSFSTYNALVDLCAPGSSVLSTIPGGGYASYSGTSMASPHAAGVAALVWSHYPTLPNHRLRNILQATANDLGEGGRDDYYGHGLINAEEAFNAVVSSFVPTVSPGPSVSPSTSAPTSTPSTSAPTVSSAPTFAVMKFSDITAKDISLNGIAGRSITLNKGSGNVNVNLMAQITGRCGNGCPSCIKAVKLALLDPVGRRVKDKCHLEHSGSICDFRPFSDNYSIDTNLVGLWYVRVEGRWARCNDGLDNYGTIVSIIVEGTSSTPSIAPVDSPFAPPATPTESPTDAPTLLPTYTPTVSPTDAPTVSPTDAATVLPTGAPTVAPTTSPTVACFDSIFPMAHREIPEASIPCEYVAASVCLCDDPNIRSHCPMTCGGCSMHGCDDSTATFYSPTGSIVSCALFYNGNLDRGDIERFCEVDIIRNTCRGACGVCE